MFLSMNGRPFKPGVPAAGHVTGRGYWHPGSAANCNKCNPKEKR